MKIHIPSILTVILLSLNCSENPTTIPKQPQLFSIEGKVENWTSVDTLIIVAMTPVDYGYPVGRETLYICGSSNIDNNGSFFLSLNDPIYLSEYDPMNYLRLWDTTYTYTSFSISDANAIFGYLGLYICTNPPHRIINNIIQGNKTYSLRNQSTLTVGDYDCRLIFVDSYIHMKYERNYPVKTDTISVTADLYFSKGWNRIIRQLTSKSLNHFVYTEYIDNRYQGKYNIATP